MKGNEDPELFERSRDNFAWHYRSELRRFNNWVEAKSLPGWTRLATGQLVASFSGMLRNAMSYGLIEYRAKTGYRLTELGRKLINEQTATI